VATAWTWPPNCSGQTGPNPCLINGGAPIRTRDVFDPSSWRGWNGTDFSLTFADPYPGPVLHPQTHVYAPVQYMPYIYAINIYGDLDLVAATLWDVYDNDLGPEGLYFSTTTDLVHWIKPVSLPRLRDQELRMVGSMRDLRQIAEIRHLPSALDNTAH